MEIAEKLGKAETINFEKDDVYDRLMTMKKGRDPDPCIDAVGAENHAGPNFDSYVDKAKQVMHLTSDRPHSLREAIQCCRNWGTVSVPGVYIGNLDNIPLGFAMNRGLTYSKWDKHMYKNI